MSSIGPTPHSSEASLRFRVALVAIVAAIAGGALTGTTAIISASITSSTSKETAQSQFLRGQQQMAYAAMLSHALDIQNQEQIVYQRLVAPIIDLTTAREAASKANAVLIDLNHDVQLISLLSPSTTAQLSLDLNNVHYTVTNDLEQMMNVASQLSAGQEYPADNEWINEFQNDFNEASNVAEKFKTSARLDLGAPA